MPSSRKHYRAAADSIKNQLAKYPEYPETQVTIRDTANTLAASTPRAAWQSEP